MLHNILKINLDDSELDSTEEEDLIDNKYLIISIDDKEYGLPIRNVIEITGVKTIYEVPGAAPYILGVTPYNNKVIPVYDLRLRFQLEKKEATNKTCMVFLNYKNLCVCFLVESVREVITIQNKEEAPRFGLDPSEKFISHLAKINSKVKILLNIEKIISEDEVKFTQKLAENTIKEG